MNKFQFDRRVFKCCAAALGAFAMLASAVASAQDARERPAPEITHDMVAQRFPTGSIRSVESAQSALEDVEAARLRVESEYARSERECYPKFFVTDCVNDAKEHRRAALAQLRAVEVEANAFKRRAKVEDRDKALAEQRMRDQADEGRRMQVEKERQAERDRKTAARPPDAAKEPVAERDRGKPASAAKSESPSGGARARRQPTPEEEAADAKQREANIAAYEKKVRDAQERQREIAAKKAEKERDRAAKAGASVKP